MGETFQRSVISSGLHKNLLFGRVARWAFLRKANITLCGVCQTPRQILTPGGIFYDLMRLMLSSLVWKQCAMFDANQTKPITQVTPSLFFKYGGWHPRSLGLLFRNGKMDTGKSLRNTYFSLQKICIYGKDWCSNTQWPWVQRNGLKTRRSASVVFCARAQTHIILSWR